MSDPVWINDFLQEENDNISAYERMIHQEFASYNYDRGFLLDNAKKIRAQLPGYKQLVEENPNYAYFDPATINYRPYNREYDPRFPPHYVNAYLEDSVASEYNVKLDNFYPLGVEIIGYSTTERVMDRKFSQPVKIGGFERLVPVSKTMAVPRGSKMIFFKVKGFEDRFSTPILPYPSAKNITPEQELFAKAGVPELPFIKLEGNKIQVSGIGNEVTEPLIIPEGYELVFEAGCELNFTNGSFLISKSPITMVGTENEPIRITSSDNSAMGFTILQADGQNRLDYVEFNGFNTLSYKGWNLTGAVNFYESDVDINEVSFTGNVCEDALNIIRSDFNVVNSTFSNTFGDAFDSDFCRGLVDHVNFDNIGNDAIDFSGSVVEINNCIITKIGDKGVSAGEGSTLTVSGTRVEGANIAYASKDNSLLSLDNCTANQVNFGLLAFQKKPEYGPGVIKTSGFNSKGAKTLFLIERYSKLTLNGTIIQGEGIKLAEMFY